MANNTIKELSSKWGFYFEKQTGSILQNIGCFSCVLQEKDVKKFIGSDVTTIDWLAMQNPCQSQNNTIVAIQCKFSNQPELNQVKAFITDCDRIEKTLRPLVFLKIYLTKTQLSRNAIGLLKKQNVIEAVKNSNNSGKSNNFYIITLNDCKFTPQDFYNGVALKKSNALLLLLYKFLYKQFCVRKTITIVKREKTNSIWSFFS